jgi:hypothetical protein
MNATMQTKIIVATPASISVTSLEIAATMHAKTKKTRLAMAVIKYPFRKIFSPPLL